MAATRTPNVFDPDSAPPVVPQGAVFDAPPPTMPTSPVWASGTPDMPSVAAPAVKAAPSPFEQNLNANYEQLNKLREQKANPWGTENNHPGALGKIAHVFSTIGNIAGDVVAPSVMANIPGTQMNRDARINQLQGQVGQEEQEKSQLADDALKPELQKAALRKSAAEASAQEQETADLPAKNAAENQYKAAQISALLHPQAKTDFEAWQKQNPTKPVEDWLHAQAATKPGNDFEQYYHDYITDNHLPDSAHNRLIARQAMAVAGQPPQRAPQITIINPQGQVQTLHSGEMVAPGSMSASQFGAGNAADVKEGKANEKASANMDSELGLMKQFEANPSPTNDVAMLMHYIGATKPESMGKIRLNENEIKLFGGTRSSLGDAEALVSRVTNGQRLTPEQRHNMVGTMSMLNTASKRGSKSESGGGAPPAGAKIRDYSTLGAK